MTPLVIDILQLEVDNDLPHWLSKKPEPKAFPMDMERMKLIRDRHRDEARGVRAGVAKSRETGDTSEFELREREWDESEHPRDSIGRFTDKVDGDDGSGSSGAEAPSGSGGKRPDDESRPEASGSDDQAVHDGLRGFARGSPRRIGGGGLLADAKTVAYYTPTDRERARIEEGGDTPLEFHELAAGQGAAYREAILAAKQGPFGAAVTAYDAADYNGMRTFITDDGKVGFALKGDDIVSVFKHPESKAKGATTSVLPFAIAQGGRRLDCFDTQLPRLYSVSGFRPVARLAFNDEYAPEGWDYGAFKRFNEGRPDVVFMVHDDAAPGWYKQGSGKVVTDYDDGLQAQKDALASKTPATDALKQHRSVTDVTDDPTKQVVGFLTPDGRLLAKPRGDDAGAHEDIANDVGVGLKRLMSEGTARIYVFGGTVLFNSSVRPTSRQVRVLVDIVEANNIDSLAVESDDDSATVNELVTPAKLRRAINDVFGTKKGLNDAEIERAYREEDHPRDSQGRWTDAGGGGAGDAASAPAVEPWPPADSGARYRPREGETDQQRHDRLRKEERDGAQASIDAGAYDHPMSRDRGEWGYSHGNSKAITGSSAAKMGIEGYQSEGPGERADTLATTFLQAIKDSPGASEPLYHGFADKVGLDWKTGDVVKLPLMATSGDMDGSAGYGIGNKDQKSTPTVFAFPKGTPMAGYARWKRDGDDGDAFDFGYVWSEAIVAGEFKVGRISKGIGSAHWQPEYRIIELLPVRLFDPKSGAWVKI